MGDRARAGVAAVTTLLACACQTQTTKQDVGSPSRVDVADAATSDSGIAFDGGAPAAVGGDLTPEPPFTAQDLSRTWVALSVPHTAGGARVARGPNGFIAFSTDAVNSGKATLARWDYLYESRDGVIWHKRRFPDAPNPYHGVSDLAYGAGRWLLLAQGRVFVSTDLTGWTTPTLPEERDAGTGDVAPFDPRMIVRLEGRFFGLGGTNHVYVSADGLAWTRIFLSLVQARGLAFGNGVFVLPGALSLRSSNDGLTWTDRTPPCTLPGIECIGPPGSPATFPKVFEHAAFADGRFYVDHISSTDGASWETYTGTVVHQALGGYLFNHDADGVRAWRNGSLPRPIAVEAGPTSSAISGGIAPETVRTPLPGGETCLTKRCVVLGAELYLLR